MKRYWSNLRSLEKRLVVAVGSALFVVLNLWIVVPHFSDWSATQQRLDKARIKEKLFQTEIAKTKQYEEAIKKLQGEALDIPQEEAAGHFASTIISVAAQNGITPGSSGRLRWDTNTFFLELSQTVTVSSREKQLVDFLHELGAGTSLVRVRDLGLHPDPSHQQLMASAKLVGSYQRKLPLKAAAAPTTKPTTPAAPQKSLEPTKAPVPAPKTGSAPKTPPPSTKKQK